MDISVFEVTGPVMIGPSSSHTAGAAKLARIAGLIAAKPFVHVSFGLHGSFAKTYRGHGTDRALVAGALGIREDDERLVRSFEIAGERGLTYDFYETDLGEMHDNSVEMTFTFADGESAKITGSSIGGGQVLIRKINSYDVEITGALPTLVVRQRDEKGVVSRVTGILAEENINIGFMRVSRQSKGSEAICVIETDSRIPERLMGKFRKSRHVLEAHAINIGEE